jgi:SRSO17 transposase
VGLDHFEGRTWAGFHHHAALCAAAHAFLAPPSAFPRSRAG